MKYYLAAILMLTSVGAHAELHKWIDSSGKVHYSDTAPPAAAQEQQLALPRTPAATASGVAPAKSIFERDADLKKALKAKQEEEQQAQQQRQDAEARRKNCENARNALRSLQDAPRVATYDEQGNMTFMDDATRQRNLDEAQRAAQEYCN